MSDHRSGARPAPPEEGAEVKRPLRCVLSMHKWETKQLSPESPRYIACAYCDALRDVRPENMPAGPNLYSRLDRDHK